MAKRIKLHGYTFQVINASTERAQRIWRAYNYSSDVTLDEVYGRYSYAKAQAYEYCRTLERAFNACDGVITGHNTCAFSYAFTGYCEGKKYLIYITKDADYAIDYDAI